MAKIRLDESGIHMFDRATGWNLLLDEFSIPENSLATMPTNVSIALTNVCDLACIFCYAPKNRNELDFDKLCSWLVELDEGGTLGIGFGGGEPTLYKRFVDVCSFAKKETQLAVTFTTHGHRLNKSLLTQLEYKVNFVRVSLEGTESLYEYNRNRSFKELSDNLTSLKNVCGFGLNFLVNSDTFDAIDSVVEFAEKMDASELLLLPQQETKMVRKVDPNTEGMLREWVKAYRGNLKLSISESSAQGYNICQPKAHTRNSIFSYAHIDASGVLKNNSYSTWGVSIGENGISKALKEILTYKAH